MFHRTSLLSARQRGPAPLLRVLLPLTLALLLAACGSSSTAAPDTDTGGHQDDEDVGGAQFSGEYRALVGLPGETKTLVLREGSIARMANTPPTSDGAYARLRFRFGDVVAEDGGTERAPDPWTLEPAAPGYPTARLTRTADAITCTVDVIGARLLGDTVDLARLVCVPSEGAGPADVDFEVGFERFQNGETVVAQGERIVQPSPNDATDARAPVPDRIRALVFDASAGTQVAAAEDGQSLRLSGSASAEAPLSLWLALPTALSVEDADGAVLPDGQELWEAALAEWDTLFDRAARFELPDAWWTQAYRVSLAHALLMRDRVGDYWIAKPGPERYASFWYRDAAYIARAFGQAGLPDEAERTLRVFWHRELPDEINDMGTWGGQIEQHEDGRWEAPPDEWDGQGQAAWGLVGHYALTGDVEWLRDVYPALRVGADWTLARTAETATLLEADDPCAGLLPVGHGESLIREACVLYHNYWAVLGLRVTARAAAVLGETEDAERYAAETELFRAHVATAAHAAYTPFEDGGGVIPAAPNAPDSRVWATIATLYPCDVLPADDAKLSDSLEYMWERRVEDQYHYRNRSNVIWTYIAGDWALALLERGEWERATALLEGYRRKASPVIGWWESIDLKRDLGGGDDPHGWAAANYVLWLRALFVWETGGDELALLQGVPPTWWQAETGVTAEGLPTEWGLLRRVALRPAGDGARLELDLELREDVAADGKLRVHLRGAEPRGVACDTGSATIDGDALVVSAETTWCDIEL